MKLRTILFFVATAIVAQVDAGTAAFTYDTLGRLTSAVYSDGVNVAYGFDATGNLQSLVIATPPSAPPVVTGSTIGAGSVTFAFIPPSIYSGSLITGFVANCTPGGLTASAGANATSITVTGLSKGTSYTCTVAANSAVGLGPPSTAQVIVGGAQSITLAQSPWLWVGVIQPIPVVASSGLPVTLVGTTPSICIAVGSATVRGLAPGSCILTATQSGNAHFLAAIPVTVTLPVGNIGALLSIIFGTDD